MRWIRKRALVFAVCVILYFFTVHARNDGFVTTIVTVTAFLLVFGSAFLDRLLFDPSAVFIKKPWRMLMPSAGDTFRLFASGGLVLCTLPLVILRGSYLYEVALFESGIFALCVYLYEFSRFYIEQVRWHGTTLSVRSKFGRRTSVDWAELNEIYPARFGSYIVFQDQSGRTAKVSRRLKGFSEFLRDAERYVPLDLKSAVQTIK